MLKVTAEGPLVETQTRDPLSKVLTTTPMKCKVVKNGDSDVQINHKIPKFLAARKHCCNKPNIQTNLRVFLLKDANGIANSEDPDQTAP